jgi:hypothetical protein
MAMENFFMGGACRNFGKLRGFVGVGYPGEVLRQQTKIPMKSFFSVCIAFTLLALAGCSTTASRIAKNETAFSEWPAAVQEKVRAGKIDLGFTPEQVRVALGEPSRVSTRTNNDGTSEVWAYRAKEPRFSFGIGLGSSRGRTGYGGGVNVGTGGDRADDATRVVFDGGRVSSIETANAAK